MNLELGMQYMWGPKHIAGTMRTVYPHSQWAPHRLSPRMRLPVFCHGGDSVSVTEVGLLKSSFCVSLSLASESVSRSCPTLRDPMDSSTPGSFVHGILQARILEWVAIPSPGDLSDLGIKPGSPTSQADSLPSEPPGMTIKKAEH